MLERIEKMLERIENWINKAVRALFELGFMAIEWTAMLLGFVLVATAIDTSVILFFGEERPFYLGSSPPPLDPIVQLRALLQFTSGIIIFLIGLFCFYFQTQYGKGNKSTD